MSNDRIKCDLHDPCSCDASEAWAQLEGAWSGVPDGEFDPVALMDAAMEFTNAVYAMTGVIPTRVVSVDDMIGHDPARRPSQAETSGWCIGSWDGTTVI